MYGSNCVHVHWFRDREKYNVVCLILSDLQASLYSLLDTGEDQDYTRWRRILQTGVNRKIRELAQAALPDLHDQLLYIFHPMELAHAQRASDLATARATKASSSMKRGRKHQNEIGIIESLDYSERKRGKITRGQKEETDAYTAQTLGDDKENLFYSNAIGGYNIDYQNNDDGYNYVENDGSGDVGHFDISNVEGR